MGLYDNVDVCLQRYMMGWQSKKVCWDNPCDKCFNRCFTAMQYCSWMNCDDSLVAEMVNYLDMILTILTIIPVTSHWGHHNSSRNIYDGINRGSNETNTHKLGYNWNEWYMTIQWLKNQEWYRWPSSFKNLLLRIGVFPSCVNKLPELFGTNYSFVEFDIWMDIHIYTYMHKYIHVYIYRYTYIHIHIHK